jgi:hypothetical protein
VTDELRVCARNDSAVNPPIRRKLNSLSKATDARTCCNVTPTTGLCVAARAIFFDKKLVESLDFRRAF